MFKIYNEHFALKLLITGQTNWNVNHKTNETNDHLISP